MIHRNGPRAAVYAEGDLVGDAFKPDILALLDCKSNSIRVLQPSEPAWNRTVKHHLAIPGPCMVQGHSTIPQFQEQLSGPRPSRESKINHPLGRESGVRGAPEYATERWRKHDLWRLTA